jgi:hypothetical protein
VVTQTACGERSELQDSSVGQVIFSQSARRLSLLHDIVTFRCLGNSRIRSLKANRERLSFSQPVTFPELCNESPCIPRCGNGSADRAAAETVCF